MHWIVIFIILIEKGILFYCCHFFFFLYILLGPGSNSVCLDFRRVTAYSFHTYLLTSSQLGSHVRQNLKKKLPTLGLIIECRLFYFFWNICLHQETNFDTKDLMPNRIQDKIYQSYYLISNLKNTYIFFFPWGPNMFEKR